MSHSTPPSRRRRDPMAGAPRVAVEDRPDQGAVSEQREAAARPYRLRGGDARTIEDARS